MDYTMCNSSTKGKKELKLIIEPTNTLERQFFSELFVGGLATIETVPNSDNIIITLKDKNES
jgi:hypothetical protein